MEIKYVIIIAIIISVVIAGGFFMHGGNDQVIISQEERSKHGISKNAEIQIYPDTESYEYGYDVDGFHNNDGLIFKNMSGGWMSIRNSSGQETRKFGFGITSDQANRSVNNWDWSWEYIENETITVLDDSVPEEPEYVNLTYKADKLVATYEGASAKWTQTYDFDERRGLKITHQIDNDQITLTHTKLWYIFTVNNDETITYDGYNYNTDVDRHLQGNLNNIASKIEFPLESFDFSDLLEDYIVTDLYIGQADMFNLPGQRIFGMAVAKSVGGSTFPIGTSVTIDPTIYVEQEDSTQNNLSTSGPATHARIENQNYYNDLIFYSPFDLDSESTGSFTILDLSDVKQDFTGTNKSVNDTNAIFNKSVFFDGVDTNQIVTIPVFTISTNIITVCAWAFPETYGVASQGRIFDLREFSFFFSGATGGLRVASGFSTTDGAWRNTEGGEGMPLDQWTHVCVCYNGTSVNTVPRAYFDGEIHTLDNLTAPEGTPNTWNGETSIIGSNLANSREFDGQIDEVMVFNRELNQSEVQEIYNNQSKRFRQRAFQLTQPFDMGQDGTINRLNVTTNSTLLLDSVIGLTPYGWNRTYNDTIDGDSPTVALDDRVYAWYHLDNRSGYESESNVFDWSGNQLNGTPYGDVLVNMTNGKYAGTYYFPGSNDGITIGTGTEFGNLCDDGCSFSTWARREIFNTLDIMVSKYTTVGEPASFRFYLVAGNDVGLTLYEFANKTSFCTAESTSDPLINNRWNMMTAVFNNTDIKLYANGEFLGETTCAFDGINSTLWHASSQDTVIGTDAGNFLEFEGDMDEVILWNRSLSDTEVNELYLTGRLKYNIGNQVNISGGSGEVTTLNISTGDDFAAVKFDYFAGSAFNFYTPYLFGNITLESYSSVAPPPENDTCTYSGSGNHEFDCSDNCVVNVSNNFGFSNVTSTGSGSLRFTENQSGIDVFRNAGFPNCEISWPVGVEVVG